MEALDSFGDLLRMPAAPQSRFPNVQSEKTFNFGLSASPIFSIFRIWVKKAALGKCKGNQKQKEENIKI